jgi:hypothetical protein
MSIYIRIKENLQKAARRSGFILAILAACGGQTGDNPVRTTLQDGGKAASLGCPDKPRVCFTGMTQEDANKIAKMAQDRLCAGQGSIDTVTLDNVDDLCPVPGIQGGPGTLTTGAVVSQ